MTCFSKVPNSAIALLMCCWCASLHGQASSAADRYADEGRQALAAGHFAEAESSFEKLQRLQPGVAEVYVTLGLIYFEEGKYESAIPTLTRALRIKPNVPKVEALVAMSLSELGRYQEAQPGLEKCFRLSVDPEVKRMCGLQLERTDTGLHLDSKAVEVALEMDRLYPDDPEVLYHSGRIYGNLAFLAVQRLTKSGPHSVWKLQAEAEAYESHGDLQAAIDAYHAVLALDPRRAGIHFRIGRTLLTQANHNSSAAEVNAALKEFEQELEIDPGSGNAAYEIAEIHRAAGELDQSAVYFDLALKRYPNFEEAHLGLAAVLMEQKKPDQAVVHLQQAIALNASNEVAWYRLSRAESMLGNHVEQGRAIDEFKRLRELHSSQNPTARASVIPDEITRQQVDINAQP